MWVEKHRPHHPARMVGNEEARMVFLTWLKTWKHGEKPALLLGPPGTGKTTLVYAAASMLGFRVLELNASDERTADRLKSILSPSLSSRTIFEEKTLVFLDEVDGLYGRVDYRGNEFVLDFIKASPNPVVMSANIEDDVKVKKLSSQSLPIKFRRIPPRLAKTYLKHILSEEEIELPEESIDKVVQDTAGDIRALLNSAQGLTREADGFSTRRDSALTLREAVEIIFSSKDEQEAYDALSRSDAQPRDLLFSIYKSIVGNDLDPATVLPLLQAISKADLILARILKTQRWRLLRYFHKVLSQNMCRVLPQIPIRFTETDLPWSIQLRVWNESRALKQIASRLAVYFHCSSREAMEIYLPYFLAIIGEKQVMNLAPHLGIEESAQKVLVKEAARVAKVVK